MRAQPRPNGRAAPRNEPAHRGRGAGQRTGPGAATGHALLGQAATVAPRGVTDVIFRRWKDRPGPAGVIAIFPAERLPAGHYGCVAPEHLEQHGSIDYRYNLRRTVRAAPEEYGPLKAHLERRGYRLRVLARMPGR